MEWAVVRAMAEAMFSQDDEVSGARLEAHVAAVDAYVSAASKTTRIGLRVALLVVRLAPILLLLHVRTLERLSVDERVAVLTALERSRFAPLSLAFIGWRTVLTLVFYEDPIELASMGYAGEERLRHKRRLPALVLAPIRLPVRVPAFAAVASAPSPDESGVRLTLGREGEELDRDSEPRHAAAALEGDTSRDVA